MSSVGPGPWTPVCANPYALMARSDVYILSSQFEGSPLWRAKLLAARTAVSPICRASRAFRSRGRPGAGRQFPDALVRHPCHACVRGSQVHERVDRFDYRTAPVRVIADTALLRYQGQQVPAGCLLTCCRACSVLMTELDNYLGTFSWERRISAAVSDDHDAARLHGASACKLRTLISRVSWKPGGWQRTDEMFLCSMGAVTLRFCTCVR